MTTALRPRTLILFVGDILSFAFALWFSLALRAAAIPSREVLYAHLLPFSVLFAVWAFVFFIAGLYDSRSIILARRALSTTLLVAQAVNMVLAALFFFFVPIFGIAPKTLLIIYLPVSFLVVLIWRVFVFPWLGLQKAEPAIVVGNSPEIDELLSAFSAARHAPIAVVAVVRPDASGIAAAISAEIVKHHPRFIIADFSIKEVSAVFPRLYNYLSRGIRFLDSGELYEEVFGRVPLSVIDDRWLARNVSRYSHTLHDSLKRLMDIIIALPAAVLSLALYPFVALAVKFYDGGPVFIAQERVGEDNKPVRIYKFRSMQRNELNLTGEFAENKVTPVGRFLRVSRIDELPQLWSIVKGDLSFVGPRPELPSGVVLYEKEIPYYGVRHIIKPGLSGWAQLYHNNHPHHATDVEATREKLSYDLYYLKHRSLALDAIIALKTIKKLLTRSGV